MHGPLTLYACYLALGLTLNRLWPLASVDDWYRLFLLATPLRLAAWAFLIYWAFRGGRGLRLLGGVAANRCLLHLAAMTALWALLVSQARGPLWPLGQAVVGLAALLPVALLEETLFRGALLRELGPRLGARGASLATALLFTLFHTRPQAIAAWPHIFLTGVVFAHLRWRGFALGQLALLHWAADALFFIAPKAGPQVYGTPHTLFLVGLALYAALTIPRASAK